MAQATGRAGWQFLYQNQNQFHAISFHLSDAALQGVLNRGGSVIISDGTRVINDLKLACTEDTLFYSIRLLNDRGAVVFDAPISPIEGTYEGSGVSSKSASIGFVWKARPTGTTDRSSTRVPKLYVGHGGFNLPGKTRILATENPVIGAIIAALPTHIGVSANVRGEYSLQQYVTPQYNAYWQGKVGS